MAKLISSEKIPLELKSKLNFVKKRVLFLSPSVVSGQEREPCKDDFEALNGTALGTGGFGKVYKVRHKVSKNVYAIKVVSKAKILENNLCEQMRLEVRIMYSLNHEHIIKLFNHFEDDEHFYLIVEYAPRGHLYEKLKTMSRLPERLVAQYMREIISAVEYLHSTNPPIIHRDIKPENILLDPKERAKLCDFGWSNFFNPNTKRMTYCGTPDYLAPEMINKAGHDQRIDLWNLGVLLFELLTGSPPFQGANQEELFQNITRLKIQYPKDFPKMAKDLVTKLLKVNPKDRISLKAALDHPWFRSNAEIRPVITRSVKIKKQLPTLDHDLDEEDFEPVSRISKVNREEKKAPITLKVKRDIINMATSKKSDEGKLDSNGKLQKAMKELSELKAALQLKTKELKVLKKEHEEMKGRLGHSKGETPDKQEIKRLNEEVKKLMLLNKNRKQTSEELVRKSSELAEASSKIKLLTTELDNLKETNKLLEMKVVDNTNKLTDTEKKLEDTIKALKEERICNQRRRVEFEAKMEEMNYMLKTSSVGEEEKERTKIAFEAAQECQLFLEGMKNQICSSLYFKDTEDRLCSELATAKEDYNKLRISCDEQMQKLKESHEEQLTKFKNKYEQDMKETQLNQNKIIEELEMQILHYEEQEGRAAMDGHKMKTLQMQNTILQKTINDLKLQVTLHTRERKFQQEKIKTTTMKIKDLELKRPLCNHN